DINGNTTWKKQAVIYKKYKFDQLNEAFIHELKMHRKLNFYSRFVQILGISLDESAEECLLIMQHAEDGNLRQYLKSHFLELSWDDKIKLSYQITEGIKYLHNEDILHQNLNPNNIVIHKNDAKIVLDFVKSTESGYSSDYGMISYIDPKLLENYSYEYDKKSDIYSLGVLMWEITSGYPPKTENISKSHNIDGCRETPIPVEYLDLCESCWNNEPDKRPSISLVFNKLVEMNKNSASQFINLIKKHTRIINRNELSDMEKIDGGHFGIISKATWKDTKVICKKLVNNESICNKPIEALRHELEMHRRLDFCQRIIRILGISLDESTKEYSLIIQYADSGNLRKYLENNFSTLTWNDKIKLAYQITEGIKFLQGEKILHRDLHSGNIVVHQGEAKIIDLGIAKSTETHTNIHSGVFGSLPYIDPKILEDHTYKYNYKSDIYSLGVLMWELSSGKPPFFGESESVLKYRLVCGHREKPESDTPDEYLNLYILCWDSEPDARPSINQVFNKLVKLGRMRGIQDFQDIKCDDDDMQGKNITIKKK
ncbi:kinase-like protein, partial [Rhizophagus irregularis]